MSFLADINRVGSGRVGILLSETKECYLFASNYLPYSKIQFE